MEQKETESVMVRWGLIGGAAAGIILSSCIFGFTLTTGQRPQVSVTVPATVPSPIFANVYHEMPFRPFWGAELPPREINRVFSHSPALLFVSETRVREVTAYNTGDKNQCDDDPCISANGKNICKAIARGEKQCAANFVPLGTRLLIENYGEFLVTDRMHRRFSNRVDIAMAKSEKKKARQFGLQRLKVTVLSKL